MFVVSSMGTRLLYVLQEMKVGVVWECGYKLLPLLIDEAYNYEFSSQPVEPAEELIKN